MNVSNVYNIPQSCGFLVTSVSYLNYLNLSNNGNIVYYDLPQDMWIGYHKTFYGASKL